ncbi:hypothetical protein MRX96_041525 [Rhipicephalus microplus]
MQRSIASQPPRVVALLQAAAATSIDCDPGSSSCCSDSHASPANGKRVSGAPGQKQTLPPSHIQSRPPGAAEARVDVCLSGRIGFPSSAGRTGWARRANVKMLRPLSLPSLDGRRQMFSRFFHWSTVY